MSIRGALVVLALLASSAQGAVVLRVSDGKLAGASGVVVGGRSYEVSFGFDSCITLFAGCDAQSDFTFQSVGDAAAASQALLDQVFVDSAEGAFNDMRDHVVGCSAIAANCGILTPYRLAPLSAAFVDTYMAIQAYQLSFVETIALMNTRPLGQQNIYAIWSVADQAPVPSPGPIVSPVTEPGTLSLAVAAALAGVALGRRRRALDARRSG